MPRPKTITAIVLDFVAEQTESNVSVLTASNISATITGHTGRLIISLNVASDTLRFLLTGNGRSSIAANTISTDRPGFIRRTSFGSVIDMAPTSLLRTMNM